MTVAPLTERLILPDAEVHYDVRGTGPLLLVVGQPMTAEPFGPLADLLAGERTVVTYDPRGLGRSTVTDPSAPVTPEQQADDLARLVETLDRGPADVLGSSGGAVTALALAARHPHLVRAVVAHEPPVTELLEDAPHVRAVVDGIEDAYRSGGPAAAWGAFVSLVMHSGPVGPDGVPPASWPPPGGSAAEDEAVEQGAGDPPVAADEPPAPTPKQLADDELFFLAMLKPFTRWLPPVDALRALGDRLVVAVGEESHDEVASRSAVALARLLGLTPAPFPGDHGGFMADPGRFAETLLRTVDRGR